MKTLMTFFLGAVISPLAFAQDNLTKSEAYYKQGIRQENAGQPEKALASYKAALQLNPKHANARYRAGQVKINKNSIKASATKTKVENVMIDEFKVEDITVSEAVQLLGLLIERKTDGEITPNFIVKDPNEKLDGRLVTLNLKKVPAGAILNFIHSQTNTKARYDQFAVVIYPL